MDPFRLLPTAEAIFGLSTEMPFLSSLIGYGALQILLATQPQAIQTCHRCAISWLDDPEEGNFGSPQRHHLISSRDLAERANGHGLSCIRSILDPLLDQQGFGSAYRKSRQQQQGLHAFDVIGLQDLKGLTLLFTFPVHGLRGNIVRDELPEVTIVSSRSLPGV